MMVMRRFVLCGFVFSLVAVATRTTPLRAQNRQAQPPGFVDTLAEGEQAELPEGPREDLAVGETKRDPIHQALQSTFQVNVTDTPLSELVGLIEHQFGIEVQIDGRAIEDAGATLDPPVTIALKDITLGAALRHILRPYDLTWAVANGALVITTPAEAEQSYLDTRIYSVADLIAPSERRPDAEENAAKLIDVIATTVSPDSWDDVGGEGAAVIREGMLAVGQVEEVHEQLAGLLAALRETHTEQTAGTPPPAVDQTAAQRALHAIDEALAKPIDLDVANMPLLDLAKKLSQERGFPVLLDAKALEEAGAMADAPFTGSVRGVSLASALEHILRQPALTWTVRDEALVITTPEEAEKTDLRLRVYPVASLVDSAAGSGAAAQEEASARELVDLVQSVLAADSWDSVGGPGSLEYEPGTQVLVCSQTEPVQPKVAALLEQLRRTREAQPEAAQWRHEHGERFEVRVYLLNLKPDDPAQGNADTVSRLIQELVEPESWHHDEAYVRPVGNRLVVRQRVRLHQAIERLLQQTALGQPVSKGTERKNNQIWSGMMGFGAHRLFRGVDGPWHPRERPCA